MGLGEHTLPELAPEFAALLEGFGDLGLSDETLSVIRPAMTGDPNRTPRDGVRVDDVDTGAGVRVALHSPTSGTPSGALLWIHGGGYVMGDRWADADLLDELVLETGIVAASVEYRLAPEHPYPAALDDCWHALEWLHGEAERLGVDRRRIGIGGLSAGGGLCAALALLARDRGRVPVAFQLLDSPMLDDRRITPSSQHPDLPVWSAASNVYGWASYLGDRSGADDLEPYAAPGRVEDLSGLPPALVMVGAVDGFRDEDVDYATRLARCGVECELHVYAGTPHGFRIFGETAVGRQSVSDIVRWLRRQLDR